MAKIYKIHPAIGIARLGNSPESYVGPELPRTFAQPLDGMYRDAEGRLKRHAARFWVFEYDTETNESRAIAPGVGDVAQIVWSVHLKNKKAGWFEFHGILGEPPVGYLPDHPLRNPQVTVDRERLLVIDPGSRTLTADGDTRTEEIGAGTSSNPAAETWPPPLNGGSKRIVSLGTLSVDAEGRLSVAGGYGVSGTTGDLPDDGNLDYANNHNWFDDGSDGPVTATVVFTDGLKADVVPAWIAVAPPDFAPPVQNVVTVHDVLFDLGLRFFGLDRQIFDAGAFVSTFRPSFTFDVFPVLQRAIDYRWVNAGAQRHVAGGKFDVKTLAEAPAPGETPLTNPRGKVFRRVRNPNELFGAVAADMPKLRADGVDGSQAEALQFTVTRFQYFALQRWAAGDFIDDWPGRPPDPATTVTAEGLDRAALEAAAGGSFFPGMEMGWILRDPQLFTEPFEFRFRHVSEEGPTGLTAGDATKRMALPWQADFYACNDNWWPAQRPNQVFVGAARLAWDSKVDNDVRMTDVWWELGIVAPDPAAPERLIETERRLPR